MIHIPSLGEMIDCRQSPGEMVRLLICRRDCNAEADALCSRCHSRHNGQGLIDRPLCAGDHRRIEVLRTFIYVVSACTKVQSDMYLEVEVLRIPRTSAMKIPWNLADSRSCASSTQWSTSLKRCDSSSGCRQSPGDWWPLPAYVLGIEKNAASGYLHISTKALRMSDFRGFSVAMVNSNGIFQLQAMRRIHGV